MSRKKSYKESGKWLSSLPIALALIFSIAFGIIEASKLIEEPSYFSSSSLHALELLNYENQMVVEDLLGEKDSILMNELVQTNIFDSVDENNKGLVVTMDEDVLLLKPVNSLSDLELETLADKYMNTIEEFEYVEIDQEVELYGEPVYRLPMQKEDEVELAEETFRVLDPVVIAVIDSGMDTDHEIFDNNIVLEGWNTITGDTDMYDDVGHGTHVAGIIASQLPGVSLVPYKIVDAQGGRLSNVLEAFDHAIEDKVNLINTSFGLMSSSYSLERLVDDAYDQGIVIISAAGNNSSSAGFYPATYEHTIAVASVDKYGQKMPKSNYGDWIDVAANGYHIRSSLPDNAYGYKTGTSQAAPFVTAAAAEYISGIGLGNDYTFAEILKALTNTDYLIEDGILAGTAIVE